MFFQGHVISPKGMFWTRPKMCPLFWKRFGEVEVLFNYHPMPTRIAHLEMTEWMIPLIGCSWVPGLTGLFWWLARHTNSWRMSTGLCGIVFMDADEASRPTSSDTSNTNTECILLSRWHPLVTSGAIHIPYPLWFHHQLVPEISRCFWTSDVRLQFLGGNRREFRHSHPRMCCDTAGRSKR